MSAWHEQTIEQVREALNVDVEKGLSKSELSDREAKYGKNKLKEGKKHGKLYKFFMQMKDMMIIVLLVAAAISATLAIIENNPSDLIEAGIILAIVLINAIIGVAQESKAENALEALKSMNKAYAKVLRDGEVIKIPAEDLYPGDIVLLEAGDFVPADIRLFESASLKIEEAALTGESLPVQKNTDVIAEGKTPLGDRKNMAYSSGSVAYGRGKGIVVATGMETEVGKIAGMLEEPESDTPLQKQLDVTAKYLSVAVLAIAVVIFVIQVILFPTAEHGNPIVNAFMTAVAIAVAAIPEGLPAVVTIVLAVGVQKMSQKRAIVRKLPAVETLGSAEIICSDKTGTLTLNQMTVVETFDFAGSGKSYDELIRCMVLCNDTKGSYENGVLKTVGDPTETALVHYADKLGLKPLSMVVDFPRTGEIPFDSERKLMTTVNEINGVKVSYTKGAPDMLLKRCVAVLDGETVRPITDQDRKKISEINETFGKRALRVLAYAMKTEGFEEENLENDLVFIGLTGMIDPPRAEVKDAVKTCKKAGMSAIMITGDHAVTAEAIAKEIGILSKGDLVMTGAELDELSDEEFEKIIHKVRVYARVSPENKVRIVRTWKKLGKVVAMTGDGVNDAPSIKMADIGIGMGITGTDVSKGVSDIVLADDNFATIILAVEEGRKIYSNIRKTVQYLLSANIAEVLTLFIAVTILQVQIFTPVMILWINLVTDSLPALALGMEHAEPDVMEKPPRKAQGSLFGGGVGIDIFIQGIMQTILVLGVFLLAKGPFATATNPKDIEAEASAMAFLTLGFVQLFHAYNMRSRELSLFREGVFNNKYMNGAFIGAAILQVVVVVVPFLAGVFDIHTLTLTEWAIAVIGGFLIIPMVEIYKLIKRVNAKKKASANE